MIYLVTYSITAKRDIGPLIEELKNSNNWWHYIDDTWLISTNESAQDLWRRIAPKFVKSDNVLIVEITKGHTRQGWLAKEAWAWIHAHERDMR